MSTYFCLLTAIGQASIANAVALNQDVQLAEMAVGDGGGSAITPLVTMTELVNEVYRIPVNTIYINPQDAGHVIAEMVIPSNQGGWTVREVGLFDADGNLFAVGNLADSVKPATGEGAGAEMTVRMHLVMSAGEAGTIQIKVDPTVVLATRQYVVQSIADHDAAPGAHPDKADAGHTHDEYAMAGHTHPIIPAIETDYIDASALLPTDDGGAASGVIATDTHGQRYGYRSLPGDADASVEITYPMPEAWDRGPIKLKAVWTPGEGASAGEDMTLVAQAVALGDGESLDAAIAAAGVTIADQAQAVGAAHVSPASAALTVEGAPDLGDLIHLRITRDVDAGATPMAADCQLLGIWLQYTCTQAVTGW